MSHVSSLRIVGADRVDEVLVVRRLDAREHARIAAALFGRGVGARALLVLPAAVRLPLAAVAVDPQPALGAVEQVADLLRALVVGVDAARGELEDRAVGVLEQRRVDVRRLLRRLRSEVAARGADLHRVLVLLQAPARDVELVRALVAGVAVAVVPVPVPVVVEAIAVERRAPARARATGRSSPSTGRRCRRSARPPSPRRSACTARRAPSGRRGTCRWRDAA